MQYSIAIGNFYFRVRHVGKSNIDRFEKRVCFNRIPAGLFEIHFGCTRYVMYCIAVITTPLRQFNAFT